MKKNKKKQQKIRIYFVDGKTDVIPQRFWDDYLYTDKLFVAIRKGEWIATYNLDSISAIIVE